jgi:hypothetical protein
VQRVAYELHGVGQNLIPCKKKHSDMGKLYQYEFEVFLCFILKTFNMI